MSTTQQLSELPAQYDPVQTERAIYERWLEAGVFSADEKRSSRNGGDREPFVIVMPPPNVTAVLHMGHGLNNTVQDVIIRWRRSALGTRHRSRRNRHPEHHREATRVRRQNQVRPRARSVRCTHYRVCR